MRRLCRALAAVGIVGALVAHGGETTTAQPTAEPTANPTAQPTTANPTAQPTTAKPTAQPTTAKPTAQPTTANPTAKPTTAKPTAQPTTANPTAKPTTAKPTGMLPDGVVLILGDDIGYGDLGCYGASKISTPRLDAMAGEGIRFTDAHSASATCTPSRFALLTGEYPFRGKRKGLSILGSSAGLVLEPGSLTLPALMKQVGFATAVVGKWHLGLGASPTRYNGVISPGPLDVGFDYAWVMPTTGDRVPCVFVENRSVANLDPADPIRLDERVKRGTPRSFLMGIPRIGEQKGGAAALWKDDMFADVIVGKAVAWLEAQTRARQRFFLYFAPQDAHTPRCPSRFAGKSQAGVRGDVVQRFDDTVGQLLDALQRLGVADNTLVVVTSDNGGIAVGEGEYVDVKHTGTLETNNGHPINGPLRGFKGDIFEGGTRVPFIARWPAGVKSPGSTSDALVGHVDMLATMARLTGQALPDAAGPDSSDVLGALLDSRTAGRAEMVLHAPRAVALRQGPWKLIVSWSDYQTKLAGPKGAQLYDLVTDIGEAHNLAKHMPARATDMHARLAKLLRRSSPAAGSPSG